MRERWWDCSKILLETKIQFDADVSKDTTAIQILREAA
jgi:hypothetical protein